MTDKQSLRLPSFIHVGPPRTGTTWLHWSLMRHTGLPEGKESQFFDHRYDRGIQWYSDLFKQYPLGMPLGEFGPDYFPNAVARERIHRHIPDCKIMCTLRDPATTLYSLYRHIRMRREPVDDTFDQYWRRLVARGFDLCCYAAHVRRWQAMFGADRVLVLFYDDLVSDPQNFLNTVCDFIAIERIPVEQTLIGQTKVSLAGAAAKPDSVSRFMLESVHWLIRRGANPLVERARPTRAWQWVRRRFLEDFEPLSESSADEIRRIALDEILEVETMTGRDLSAWKPVGSRNGTLPESRAAATSHQ